jgi:hypothetical protein
MLTASINGANEIERMNEGEEQITLQRDQEITSQGGEEIAPQEGEEEVAQERGEKEIEPPDW